MLERSHIKVIRDPIHGYIYLDALEHALANASVFQRLQYVKQSATAYMTYPAHQVNRYCHSLGTMELAGRMFDAAIRNASRETRLKFEGMFADAAKVKKKEAIAGALKLTRLLGMLHDLGHLPFSHISEGALKDREEEVYPELKKRYVQETAPTVREPLHELATRKLIGEDQEIRKAFQSHGPAKLRELVLKALDSKSPSILHTVHELVSGEVDADRGDFLLRDGATSGIDFGRYDISRLVDCMTLVDDGKSGLKIRPSTKGISTVETFLVERYKLYKWLYWHQHVVLTDLCLEKSIQELLLHHEAKGHPCRGLLSPNDFAARNYVREGQFFDDVYLWNVLREAHAKCAAFEPGAAKSSAQEAIHQSVRRLRTMLEILLLRRPYGFSVIKGPEGFEAFEAEVREELMASIDRDHWELEPSPVLNKYAKALAGHPVVHGRTVAEEYSKEPQRDIYVLETERATWKPYNIDLRRAVAEHVSEYEFARQGASDKPLVPISRVSGLVRHLQDVWSRDCHVFFFLLTPWDVFEDRKLTRPADLKQWRERCGKHFCAFAVKHIAYLCSQLRLPPDQ